MQRIERLRRVALDYTACYDEFYYLFHKAHDADAPITFDSYAAAYATALHRLTVHIEPDELIVGRTDRPREEQMPEWLSTYRAIANRRREQYNGGGNENSHMAIDYELVLREGLYGIIARIDGYLLTCDEDKKDFYRCARTCCEAVIVHAAHYADEAERQAALCEDEVRRAELLELSRICRRVPAFGAESFYEAVQSAHFITYAISLNPLLCFQQQFQLWLADPLA
jgi:hypothetical protein